jgi:hypothetical protein
MTKLRILAVCAMPTDPTSWYRAWGVYGDIMKRSDIEFDCYEDLQKVSWKHLIKYDLVIFQRALGNATQLAEYITQLGIPYVYDLDDNFWEIPRHSAIKSTYNPKILGTMEKMMKGATAITVSTKALGDYIENKLGIKCNVINNGIDLNKYKIQPYNKVGKTIWRGSSTHIDDVRQFAAFYESVAKQVNQIEFWGHDCVQCSPRLDIKNSKFFAGEDLVRYFRLLQTSNIAHILCTLVDDEFNRAKSNIAWIEATLAGGVCVGNQVGEFKDKQILMNDFNIEHDYQGHYIWSKQLIHDKYNLLELNDKRIELYKKVVGK